MHPSGPRMGVTCIDIEALDVSNEIVSLHWTEDKPKLDNKVTYHWCFSTIQTTLAM